jgi:hypothetical protein
MKTIYDPRIRAGLIARINALTPDARPLWGKMTAAQMLKHCRLWEEMAQGRITCKRSFIGRLIGKWVLARLVSNDRPLDRNTPSAPELIVRGEEDPAGEKAAWIACIQAYGNRESPGIVHPFFGWMTGEEIGILAYKHADHHLRQFNA